MTDREKELYFVISEWWDEVFSTAVRENRVENINKLIEYIIELETDTWDDPIPDGVDPWNLRGRG
jgi:hypothetical protein